MALGAVEGDQLIMLGVLMVSSLLSIGYLMPVVGRAFLSPPPEDGDGQDSGGIKELFRSFVLAKSVNNFGASLAL